MREHDIRTVLEGGADVDEAIRRAAEAAISIDEGDTEVNECYWEARLCGTWVFASRGGKHGETKRLIRDTAERAKAALVKCIAPCIAPVIAAKDAEIAALKDQVERLGSYAADTTATYEKEQEWRLEAESDRDEWKRKAEAAETRYAASQATLTDALNELSAAREEIHEWQESDLAGPVIDEALKEPYDPQPIPRPDAAREKGGVK